MTKRCPKCGETKNTDLFYKCKSRYDGITVYCKECLKNKVHSEAFKKWMREYIRKKVCQKIVVIPELEKKLGIKISDKFMKSDEKTKYSSRSKSRICLKEQPCVICGSVKEIERHHFDYSKPLEVVFLCSRHHRTLHTELRRLYKFNCE